MRVSCWPRPELSGAVYLAACRVGDGHRGGPNPGLDVQAAASAVEDFLVLTGSKCVPCQPKSEASPWRPSSGSEKGVIPPP